METIFKIVKFEKNDGYRWHTVTINDMVFGSYYKIEEVNDKFIEIAVSDVERLANLGFS